MKQLFTFLLLAFIYVGVGVGVQASDVTTEKPEIEYLVDHADVSIIKAEVNADLIQSSYQDYGAIQLVSNTVEHTADFNIDHPLPDYGIRQFKEIQYLNLLAYNREYLYGNKYNLYDHNRYLRIKSRPLSFIDGNWQLSKVPIPLNEGYLNITC